MLQYKRISVQRFALNTHRGQYMSHTGPGKKRTRFVQSKDFIQEFPCQLLNTNRLHKWEYLFDLSPYFRLDYLPDTAPHICIRDKIHETRMEVNVLALKITLLKLLENLAQSIIQHPYILLLECLYISVFFLSNMDNGLQYYPLTHTTASLLYIG